MVTNKENGKKYIGQTTNSFEQRKHEHVYDALGNKKGMYFHKAIRKYGVEAFDWQTLYECDNIEDLNKAEIYYIQHYDTFENGYNLTLGGRNAPHSEETKRKMSISKRGENNPMFGVHLCGKDNPMYGKKLSAEHKRILSEVNKGKIISEEHKQKISEANKGKDVSEETCKKISEANKGRKISKETRAKMSIANKGKNNSMYGKKHLEKTKRKMSEANRGKNNGNARAIIIDHRHFDTIREAEVFLGVGHGTIFHRLKNQWSGYEYV